jgi:hypothetical protein
MCRVVVVNEERLKNERLSVAVRSDSVRLLCGRHVRVRRVRPVVAFAFDDRSLNQV